MKLTRIATMMFALAGVAGAHAAQPASQPAAQTGAQPANASMSRVVPVQPAGPGSLTGLTATPAVADVGKSIKFKLAGSGPCKLTLWFGDSAGIEKQGTLPFEIDYAYSTTSMNSTDAFKTYSAKAEPQGACKAKGVIPVSVTINNPNPQGAVPASSNSGNPNTVTLDGNGANGLVVKPK